MTKAEKYYNDQYRTHLREYRSPSIKRVEIAGKVVTPEEAAAHRAGLDLKYFKQRERQIQVCCKGMEDNLKIDMREPPDERADAISVLASRDPDSEPNICLGGNKIRFCPFCGTEIKLYAYIDEPADK